MSSAPDHHRPSPHPGIEPLERRQLRASVGISNHLVTVVGSATSANTITVGASADLTSVVATLTYQTGAAARAVTHTVTQSFPLTDHIKGLRVSGGGRADTITIDQTYEPFTIATTITGGGGADTIQGGDEPDLIFGNGGADSIDGGSGNDVILGGAGSDVLVGGQGDDYLEGDGGRDFLEGDAGNDTIRDGRGPDTVLGGAGQDVFEVHSLRRDIDNDYDPAQGDILHIIAAPGPGDTTSTGLLGSLFPITGLL